MHEIIIKILVKLDLKMENVFLCSTEDTIQDHKTDFNKLITI